MRGSRNTVGREDRTLDTSWFAAYFSLVCIRYWTLPVPGFLNVIVPFGVSTVVSGAAIIIFSYAVLFGRA